MAYGTDKLKIIDELMCNMKYIVTWRTPLTTFFTVKTSNYIHGETRTTYLVNFCCSFIMRKFNQSSIFHSGFLGEVQFKFDLKKWTFEPKSEVVFKKNHKKWTFQKHGALFKSEVAFKRIRYFKRQFIWFIGSINSFRFVK